MEMILFKTKRSHFDLFFRDAQYLLLALESDNSSPNSTPSLWSVIINYRKSVWFQVKDFLSEVSMFFNDGGFRID